MALGSRHCIFIVVCLGSELLIVMPMLQISTRYGGKSSIKAVSITVYRLPSKG